MPAVQEKKVETHEELLASREMWRQAAFKLQERTQDLEAELALKDEALEQAHARVAEIEARVQAFTATLRASAVPPVPAPASAPALKVVPAPTVPAQDDCLVCGGVIDGKTARCRSCGESRWY